MKKSKSIILMALVALSVFAFAGRVSAEPTRTTFKNQTIICDPQSIEVGQTADCYLVGQQDGDVPFNGFVGVVYTSDDLILKDVKTDVSGAKAAMLTAGNSLTSTQVPNNQYVVGTGDETGTGAYVCDLGWYDLSETQLTAGGTTIKPKITTAKSSYCAVIYSESGTNQAFKASELKSIPTHHSNSQALKDSVTQTYAVLGIFTVELDANTTKSAGSRCGDICVRLWTVPAATYYKNVNTCNDQASVGSSNPNCPTAVTDSVDKCVEVHIQGAAGTNEPTGAFASYAILAAGAFIAISAVAIAKKNNKLYKI